MGFRCIIWCRGDIQRGIEPVRAFDGKLPAIPRVGDYVVLFEDWAASRVLSVYWDIPTRTVEIEVNPDYTGEIKAEIEKTRRG